MSKFFFTYGSNHKDKDGLSLGNAYTPIVADHENEARDKMYEARGSKWSMCYTGIEFSGQVAMYGLHCRDLESVTIPDYMKEAPIGE